MAMQRVSALLALVALLSLARAAPLPASNAGLAPQRLVANGLTNYYQVVDKPKGTMVLIHGCGPGANAFFPQDPVSCPECWGLPEYLSQLKLSLASGYNTLVLQASDVGSGCWSSSSNNGKTDDRPQVVALAEAFQRNHSATDLPLYVQGYSSGGTMCLKLPQYLQDSDSKLRIDGVVTVDAAPRGGFNAEGEPGKLRQGLDYPPTLFVVMKSGGANERAPAQIDFLQANGVPADMIVSSPRKVTPTYFSDRIVGMTPPQSASLVAKMRQLGGIDADDNLVGWALDAAVAQLPWLAADSLLISSVGSQMRIAVGDHENMGEFTAASLAWLEAGGEADLPALLKELVPSRPSQVTVDGLQAAPAAGGGDFGVQSSGGPAAAPGPGPAII